MGVLYGENVSTFDIEDSVLYDELNFNRQELLIESVRLISMMNQDQKVAYDEIMGAVQNCIGGFFFVYGYGGTGKTFLWNVLSTTIRSKGQVVLNVVSSGIASLLLPNGRTVHSRFKVPLSIGEDSICNIKPGSALARLISFLKLIIWDEAPISSKFCYEALDKCFRDILRFDKGFKTDIPFAGKVVVFSLVKLSLSNYDYFKERCILAPTLDVVSEVNSYVMSLIPGEHQEYLSSDSVCRKEGNMEAELYTMSAEMLNLLNCSGMLQHKLELKIGVPVMLLRNIDQSNGLCNGTRLQVRRLGDHVVECLILTGRNIGDVILIPRMNLVPNNETLAVKFTRR